MHRSLVFVLACAMATPLAAALQVDGTRDAAYGAPLAVQTVQTRFGDSSGGISFGGELDAAYATVEGGRLYVLLTGNLENNGSKLNVFIDSRFGGFNEVIGSQIPLYDFLGASQNLSGLTFDAGFSADYHLFGRWLASVNGGAFAVDIASYNEGTAGGVSGGDAATGAGTAVQSGVVSPGGNGMDGAGNRTLNGFITEELEFGFNNHNAAGVSGGIGAADTVAAAAVTTGFEFSIALADIGNPSGVIKIHAVVGASDHSFLSNQTLGGLPAGTDNLGSSVPLVNFNNFAGDQFFTVAVPGGCDCNLDDVTGVDVFDLLRYLNRWFPRDHAAERTGDDPAAIDVFDLLDYLDCWFSNGTSC